MPQVTDIQYKIKLKNVLVFFSLIRIFAASKIRIMIATGQTTTNQKAKATTTRERVMASTVSVDEYFDELISQVHQDYAEL